MGYDGMDVIGETGHHRNWLRSPPYRTKLASYQPGAKGWVADLIEMEILKSWI